jgi:hypothetical protein
MPAAIVARVGRSPDYLAGQGGSRGYWPLRSRPVATVPMTSGNGRQTPCWISFALTAPEGRQAGHVVAVQWRRVTRVLATEPKL